MNDHLSEDDCLDLLRGFLPDAAEEQLLAHAESCPRCERLLAHWAGHQERVRSRGNLRVRPDGSLTLEPHEINQPDDGGSIRPASLPVGTSMRAAGEGRVTGPAAPARPPRAIVTPWRAVAGLGLAAAAIALWLGVPRPRDPVRHALHPLPAPGTELRLRDEPESRADARLRAGVGAYEREDLRAAVGLLAQAETTGPHEVLRRLYLGSALARLGHHRQAVDALEGLDLPSIPDPWGGEGRWTLAVSLRALGRHAEADTILAKLAEEPGEIGSRAREALAAR